MKCRKNFRFLLLALAAALVLGAFTGCSPKADLEELENLQYNYNETREYPWSGSVELGYPVFADIVYLEPDSITHAYRSLTAEDVFCKAETVDGTELMIHYDRATFENQTKATIHFSPLSGGFYSKPESFTYNTPLRIHGIIAKGPEGSLQLEFQRSERLTD